MNYQKHTHTKAIFLDRDGVLNHAIIKNGKPYPPKSLEELKIVHDAFDALTRLKIDGFLLICVTNQPDVARGTTAQSSVEHLNSYLIKQLPLDEILVCYHDDHHTCECRKPKPGLLLMAAQKYNIDTKKSFMIGDRWRDIEAGQNAHCKTIWLNYGYDEKQPVHVDYTTSNLTNATNWILKSTGSRGQAAGAARPLLARQGT